MTMQKLTKVCNTINAEKTLGLTARKNCKLPAATQLKKEHQINHIKGWKNMGTPACSCTHAIHVLIHMQTLH